MSASTWSEHRGNGRYRIVWRKKQGGRCYITLGKSNQKSVRHFQVRLNELIEHSLTGTPLTSSLTEWLDDLTDSIRTRLVELKLIEAVHGYTLAQWIEFYNNSRTLPGDETRRKWANTCDRLTKMFGGDIPLSAITAAHAEEFREHLLSNGKRDGVGLARATVNKHCSIANQYFKAAYKRRVITENPFEGIECRNLPNRERMAFVEPQQITQLLEHLPMWQDRVTLGLARYGGLRCPSEVLALKWEHIHLGDNTKNDPSYMMVRNEKTMHHSSVSEYRKVPLFPELAPFIQEAWDMSKPGAVYVISDNEVIDSARNEPRKLNMRSRFTKAIKRAGMEQWPKLFQNLRSSRQTELCAVHQPYLVCRWMGNTEAIAINHYLQETGQHLAQACTIPTANPTAELGAHTGADTAVMSPQPPSQKSAALENKAFPIIDLHGQSQEMPLVGDEGRELWCSKAFIYRSSVRAGHFSGGAGGGAHAT